MSVIFESVTDIILYGTEGILFFRLLTDALRKEEVTKNRKRVELAIMVLLYFVLRMIVTHSTWVQQLFYGEQLYIQDSKDSIVSVLCSFAILICVAMLLFRKWKKQVFYLTTVYMAISEMVRFGVYCLTRWLPDAAFSIINKELLETKSITMEQYYSAVNVIQEGWTILFFGLYLVGMILVVEGYRRYLLQAVKLPQGQELVYLTIPALTSICFSILLRSILIFMQDGKMHIIFERSRGLYGVIHLEGMERALSEFSIRYQTGNTVTDVIITRFSREAKQKEIKLECCFGFPKEKSIDPFDMSIILNNGWNNALEACEKLEKEKRWVSIKGIQKEGIFFLELKNAMSGNLLWKKGERFPHTIKQDAVSHGMGLKNMENTVKKYQGHMEWHQEGQVFRVTIMLPLVDAASIS